MSSDVVTILLEDASSSVQHHFEIDKNANFTEVFETYANFQNLALNNLQFTYRDKSISADEEETPSSLNMNLNNDFTIKVTLTGQALVDESLAKSCMAGSVDSVIEILKTANSDVISRVLKWSDSDGDCLRTPPLFIAIDYGHCDLISQMLPFYTTEDQISTIEGNDYTALQWACWKGNLDIIKLLVEQGGAKVDEEALSLAKEENHDSVVDWLLKNSNIDIYAGMDDVDAVMDKACREGDSIKVRQLLDEDNYDVGKWKDENGDYLALSPMYMAIKFGHYEVVNLFSDR